jgi:hypothetical protein
MNHFFRTCAPVVLLLLLVPPAFAGPGAHGPNGEHLDAPTPMQAGPALPRLEARTEAFELVAELRPAGLVVMVDRYETNAPVLGARLDVESGGVKAVATYRPEQGDYAVADAALLKVLAAAGEHGLVFTLVAGAESDLLDGTLVTPALQAGHGQPADSRGVEPGHAHGHPPAWSAWIGGGIAGLAALGSVAWWRQRRRSAGRTAGAL